MVVGDFPIATDVLVVGGGPGGYAAAIRTANRGLATMLVERDALGGTCLNVGCIPSKALLHGATLASSGEHASSWGIEYKPTVDMERLQDRIESIVATLTGGVGHLLRGASVEIGYGSVEFVSPTRARVIDREGSASSVEFREVIVATGSRPVGLPNLPFDGVRVLDSTGLLALRSVPTSLAVIGGGYIGVELGTAFAKLGSAVTIVELEDRLLSTLDSALAGVVSKGLIKHGVTIATSTRAVGLDEDSLVVSSGGREYRIDAEVVLVAVGRRPNTDGIGLEALGVTPATDGFIEVDPGRRASRTACAIGDVTRGPGLAHKAYAEAEVVAQTVSGGRAAFDPACIPMVVFSDPEIASVGYTLHEAKSNGLDAAAFRFPLSASGRAMVAGDTDGFVQVVVENGSGLVLGAHMAGPNVSELALAAGVAIEMGATATDLAMTIAAHPTLTEALVESAQLATGSPLHAIAPRSTGSQ